MYEYRAEVTRVVDGDTVDMVVDLGFGMSMKTRFRLYGIDAPELRGGTPESKALAKEATAWLVEQTTGKQVIIKTYKDAKGKYGRYLCTILSGGTDLCAEMVKLGYAIQTK